MLPELGHFALMLALLVSALLGFFALAGAHLNRADWMAFARPGAQALWLLTAFSFACLTYAFYTNDFSVLYVSQHSNTKLPVIYRIAAVWGGHEGSLLLWLAMLCTWMIAVSLFSRQLPDVMLSRVLGVMGLISVGFLLFMLITSSPVSYTHLDVYKRQKASRQWARACECRHGQLQPGQCQLCWP